MDSRQRLPRRLKSLSKQQTQTSNHKGNAWWQGTALSTLPVLTNLAPTALSDPAVTLPLGVWNAGKLKEPNKELTQPRSDETRQPGDATEDKVNFPGSGPRQLSFHMFAFAALNHTVEKQGITECLHFIQRKLNFCPEDALPNTMYQRSGLENRNGQRIQRWNFKQVRFPTTRPRTPQRRGASIACKVSLNQAWKAQGPGLHTQPGDRAALNPEA